MSLESAGYEPERIDAVHSDPVWRDRADFLIGATLAGANRAEQLWARQIDTQQVEICCIPFFIYDVALGDIVETDAKHEIVRVVAPSGRFVFRVWFGDAYHSKYEITDELSGLGALLEWSSENLLAVDAFDDALAEVIAEYLDAQQSEGRLAYETGRS